jgi:hypothetical protein
MYSFFASDVLAFFAIGVNVKAAIRYAIEDKSKTLIFDIIGFAIMGTEPNNTEASNANKIQ